MKYTVSTTLCLAGLLLAVAAPSFGQVTPRTAPAFVQPMPRPLQVEEADPEARAIAADTTLSYYDLSNGAFDQNLGGEIRAVGTFFTAPSDGTIDRVDFELSNFPPSLGVNGTGTVRIKLIEGTEVALNPPFSPGIDSLDVDFSELMAHGIIAPGGFINQIDVSGRNFEIQDRVEYFLQLALIDESADSALTFIFDGGSDDSTDTRYFIDGEARTLAFLDFVDPDTEDGFFSLRNSIDTSFVHLNVLLELQLTADEPPPPPPLPPTASMQFIHNAPGADAVDLYVGDSLVVDDLGFREATSFFGVPAGQQTIDVVAAGDPSNSAPIFSTTDSLAENQPYWAMALLSPEQTVDMVIEPIRSTTIGVENQLAVIVAHGGVGVDSVNVRILDETRAHNVVDTLALDLGVGQFAEPAAVDSSRFNVEVSTNDTTIDVFRVEVNQDQGLRAKSALLLLTSGILDGDPSFGFITVDLEGNVAMPPVNTATEPRVVPTRFVLHNNYPNPFNPTTTIHFDLDMPGFTTLIVYNLLGQEVATLVAKALPVGAYQVAFDASGLPSGPYVYRLTSGRFSQQRMLMVIK